MSASASSARQASPGRLAGILFLVGAAASIPANLLFRDPSVGLLNHVMVGIAIVSGLACLLAPWERIPAGVFHVIPPMAAGEVALTVWAVDAHGPVYEWFFILIAVFTAYAFTARRSIAIHMGICTAAALAPLLYADDRVATAARLGVFVPMLLLATTVVAYLREGMEARQAELAELARRDPLTGIGNRRVLDDRLRYELARHRRTGRELSLLVLDLDGFKTVNDVEGHVVGDRVLGEAAAVLERGVRSGDTVVRHGGDEFCVVAPETSPEAAAALAERVRAALSSIEVLGRPLTASIGLAVFPHDGDCPASLLAAADVSERAAKAATRRAAGPRSPL